MTDNALKVFTSLYCFTTSVSHGVEIVSRGCGVQASLMLFSISLITCFVSKIICSTKARSAASIILRGANDFMVDEMERSVHDALCVVKRVLESKSVVPGGGAVETALSIYLENFATSLVSEIFIQFAHHNWSIC